MKLNICNFLNCPKKMVSNGFIMFETGAPLQPPFICYSLLLWTCYSMILFNIKILNRL